MDYLYVNSTEFRKTFARSRSPMLVTANGHVIGKWVPVDIDFTEQAVVARGFDGGFVQFRPAPKPGKGKP